MSLGPTIGYSDLLECLDRMEGMEPERLAPFFRLQASQSRPQQEREGRETRVSEAERVTGEAMLKKFPPPPISPASQAAFLRPVSYRPGELTESDRSTRAVEQLTGQAPITDEDWFGPGDDDSRDRPGCQPLQPKARVWPFLKRALGNDVERGSLDVERLVDHLARRAPIERIPRRRRLAWSSDALVLCDYSRGLLPFRDDLDRVNALIEEWRGLEGVQFLDLEGARLRDTGTPLEEAPLPPPGTPVLAVTDFGCLSGNQALIASWKTYGRKLLAQGNYPTALVPCPRNRWDAELAAIWSCSAWDRDERPLRGGQGQSALDPDPSARNQKIKALLPLLAPAVRVEAGLLRDLRYLLSPGEADVGTEYDLWHHSEIASSWDAVAIASSALDRWKNRLAEREGLADEVRACLERWHTDCSRMIWARELINAHECGAKVSDEALTAARDLIAAAAARMGQLGAGEDWSALGDDGFSLWQEREWLRISGSALQAESGHELAYAVRRQMEGELEDAEQIPEGLDPERLAEAQRWLEEGSEVERWWMLRQVGPDLVLRSVARDLVSTPAEEPGAPVAWFSARRLGLTLSVTGVDEVERVWDVRAAPRRDLRIRVGAVARCELRSDGSALVLEAEPRPEWAREWGYDASGLFAVLTVNGVDFRFRWIGPGMFWMGSPEGEEGRYGDELLHRVILTSGFWLGETPCTQRQWKAIRQKNPSQHEGDDLPVENVSWEDARKYCQRLNELFPEPHFRLPTEAEWECACRAGTATPFNNGGELSKVAWFDGNSDGKTHPVGELLPNRWGLFDMHGNVWEWCEDHVDSKYLGGQKPWSTCVDGIVNPLSTQGVRRVVRGGCFRNDPRDCRSAIRFANGPGDRSFRLAAGHSLKSKSASGAGA